MTRLVESLPANWYCSPDIFRREREKIFSRNWSFICPADNLVEPGQYITAQISGQSVVVCRDASNRLRGYLNVCRHRASPVCLEPAGKTARFICPYHAWNYALDGQLLNAPGFEQSIDKREFGLMPVRIATWNSLVFACLDMNCEGLSEWLGGIIGLAEQFPVIEGMEFYVRLSNTLMANWKNYSDNSAEGYHLATIHPALHQSLTPGTRVTPYEIGKYVGFEVTNRTDGSLGYWVYKFPGLLMHFGQNSFNIERITALEANRTQTERWFWFAPEASDKEREDTVAFSNRIMHEDIEICSRVQENLQAGHYVSGVLSETREPGTIFFQSCVRQALEFDE